jgi:transposase
LRALPLHNNKSEAALRRQAVGRRNWTFLGNDAGGVVNTSFVSLLASCKLRGIEPWGFCLIGDWKAHRVLELAPAYWRKTLEQPETQQRLAANPFRNVSLGTLP